MKKLTTCAIIIFTFFSLQIKAQSVDSMQKILDTTKNNCLKAELYINIATALIEFEQPKTKEISYADAGKAVDFVLKAIHINSRDADTIAIRHDFDCLAQAYFIQKKYTQAKWFILQSNCISRDRRDVSHIIYSLRQLAEVKAAIKDYKLAQQDLKEAITLSIYKKDVPSQIMVEKQLAALYDKTANVKAAKELSKHYTLLGANLHKEELKYVALQKARAKKHPILANVKQSTTLQDTTTAAAVATNEPAATTGDVLAVNNK